jgi:RNA polymerase-binding transcription factor DksA
MATKKAPARKESRSAKSSSGKLEKPKLAPKKPATKPAGKVKPEAAAKKAKPATESARPAGSAPSRANGSGSNGGDGKSAVKLAAFTKKQHQRLLALRDELMDQLAGVTRETLRKPSGGGDSSAFGMHQADAGSDAYDRDFALNLLSQEQNALYEVEEALKRIESGIYGICEMSGKRIAQARLEAIPFARFTVECQAQIEKEQKLGGYRRPQPVVFGAGDDEDGEGGFGFSSDSDVDSEKG